MAAEEGIEPSTSCEQGSAIELLGRITDSEWQIFIGVRRAGVYRSALFRGRGRIKREQLDCGDCLRELAFKLSLRIRQDLIARVVLARSVSGDLDHGLLQIIAALVQVFQNLVDLPTALEDLGDVLAALFVFHDEVQPEAKAGPVFLPALCTDLTAVAWAERAGRRAPVSAELTDLAAEHALDLFFVAELDERFS